MVDINEQSKKERKEQLWRDGDGIENEIVAGKEIFLGEIDRSRLKSLVEGVGIELLKIEGKADLSGQADQLAEALGGERLKKMMPELMAEVVNNPAGEVFKGESVKPENAEEQIKQFVGEYIGHQLAKGEFVFDPNGYDDPQDSWKKNMVYRIEAVMSVTNKLLWILQAEESGEAERRQGTNGVLKHLRERVMRGAEKAGEVITPEVKRSDEKIIRHLPPRSVGVILEHLTRV